MKWILIRFLLRTVGRLSEGIRIGYRHGFDSGTMLDYVYADKSHGWLGLGKVIDRVYLNAVGWRAIRARRALLHDVLREEVSARAGRALILDVASGPGRYLQDLAKEQPETRVVCRDLATDGLALGEKQAAARGLTNIVYEQGDAFEPAPLDRPADVIVVSGLYELMLDEELISKSIARLRDLLAPDGVLIFTTQTRHPQLEFIANVLPNRDGVPWVMECRSVQQAHGWAREAGFEDVVSRMEKVGLFAVTTAHNIGDGL
ncbi:methyltransferase domain-containing protein [Nonomuraea sp. KC401]|uniref:class I SAM-dependent methyltransferase family protein n=1 Tax=unclassified Nonomuraea TaxID=2593643 RepID=UPI0010FE7AF3|nr:MULTISPECIES: class I SAM-dependent methyltransferase family protein [unclassified Nonomuraea]NBE95437.1 methyltransferase domain-containing protein [Nonomuraea sp. K271]TLF66361.1 methyltransferase domain-containing protein [Nonomuraea sp. KC401]